MTFHAGTPLVASDVVYSFERLVDPETASASAADLASMDTIEAPDDAPSSSRSSAGRLAPVDPGRLQRCIIYPEEIVEEERRPLPGRGRHRAVHLRRVRAEHPRRPREEPELLGGGAALPRRHRDDDRLGGHLAHHRRRHRHGRLHRVRPAARHRPARGDEPIALAGDANTNIRFIGFNLTQGAVQQPARPPGDRHGRRPRARSSSPAVFGHGTPTTALFPPTYWAALQQEIPPPDVEGAKAADGRGRVRRRLRDDDHLLVAVLLPLERRPSSSRSSSSRSASRPS